MLARFLLLFTVIIWGWTFVATKICLQFLTPSELLAARFVMATPLMWLLMRLRGNRLVIAREFRVAATVSAGLFLIHFLVQTLGLVHTSATNTGWIITISPLAMALLAYFILKERMGVKTIVGIGVALVGVLLLVSRGRLASVDWLRSVGDWLVLTSAFTWSLYAITTRNLSRSHPPMVVTVVMLVPAMLILCGYVFATSSVRVYTALSGEAVVALLFLGFLGMGLAHWFWLEGVSRLGAARAGVFLYLEPLATTALAVPYLHEPFGVWSATGGLLVLAGVYYASLDRK